MSAAAFSRADTKGRLSAPAGWIALVGAVLAARVALIAAACLRAGISLDQFALLHDGWEYLRMSQAMARLRPGEAALENFRLFPGYPAAMALLGFGAFPVTAGLALSLGGAALSAALAARLARDMRAGWWLAAFTPSWLLYTSVVMSEGLSSALALLGLWAIPRRRWALAGLFAGLGVTVRPVGAALFLPLLWETAIRLRDRRATAAALAAGLPWPLAQALLSHFAWGGALRSVSDYGGLVGERGAPLESLFVSTFDPGVKPELKILVWGMIALTLAGAAGLALRWRAAARESGEGHGASAGPTQSRKGALGETETARGAEAGPARDAAVFRPICLWHAAATLFYLFSPGYWMFFSMDRYLSALWPTSLIGLLFWAPRGRGARRGLAAAGALLAAAAWFVALRWLVHLAAVYPFEARALP